MQRSSMLAIVSVLAIVGTVMAATARIAASTKASEAWASGVIEKYDSSDRSLVVKQGSHEMTFVLAENAHLMLGKKTVQPGDLQGDVGRSVKVRYTTNAGKKVADRLEIGEVPAAKTSTKK